MDVGQTLELFHWPARAQLVSPAVLARVASALIIALSIGWLVHFLRARRRGRSGIREQLERWAQVSDQRRFFEGLRSRSTSEPTTAPVSAFNIFEIPGMDRRGGVEGSSVSELLSILNSEEAAPRASPQAFAPEHRKTASR
jgi:hypothetical protein